MCRLPKLTAAMVATSLSRWGVGKLELYLGVERKGELMRTARIARYTLGSCHDESWDLSARTVMSHASRPLYMPLRDQQSQSSKACTATHFLVLRFDVQPGPLGLV